ncbi:Nitrogen regulatory protein P-II [bioreactor metagenome]|uniref:Nitrogen regulatory protein P-II n=1 Tax=bioreactor metagenome TaxID=1076179 RepID=A0A644V3T6_9ZZZZ
MRHTLLVPVNLGYEGVLTMKEIMAFIRLNKVNDTRDALARAGLPSFTCSKGVGRGKKPLASIARQVILDNSGEVPANEMGESLVESIRLVPRRCFSLVVDDEIVPVAIKTIIEVNQTGNPGDGKIFVLPIGLGYNIRTGETQDREFHE